MPQNIFATDDSQDADDRQHQTKKSNEREIGIVKFFDSYKGFGFVVIGSKEVRKTQGKSDELRALYFNYGSLRAHFVPRKSQWITLIPKKDRKKWRASEVTPLLYDSDGLQLAMKYRADNARIQGTNKDTHYDEDILYHIIEKMIRSEIELRQSQARKPAREVIPTGKREEVIDAFCAYISRQPVEREEAILSEFLLDNDLRLLLRNIFSAVEYKTSDERKRAVYTLFLDKLFQGVIESGTLYDLSKLPSAFNFTPHLERVTTLLINEAKSTPELVMEWLRKYNCARQIKLSEIDVDTLPLRAILSNLTGNNTYVEDIAVDWPTIKLFVKEAPDRSYQYVKLLFTGKDEEYVRSHEITDILDDEVASTWAIRMMEDGSAPLTLLRYLMEHRIEGNLGIWQTYIEKGYDIAPLLPRLLPVLSAEVKTKQGDVHTIIKELKSHNISTDDIFDNAKNLSDELYTELLVTTGESRYLGKLRNPRDVADWLWQQQHKKDYISSFVSKYKKARSEADQASGWAVIMRFVEKDTTSSYSYVWPVFVNEDENYVRTHEIATCLGDEAAVTWAKALMEEKTIPLELLRSLMEYRIEGNLETWIDYVDRGYEFVNSIPALRSALNSEIKTNAKVVRKFLNTCEAHGLSITDFFESAEDLSDEMYAELFVSTGDFGYLDLMEDFDTTASWVSEQPAPFVVSFIRQYGEWLLGEGAVETDTYIRSIGELAVVGALKSIEEDEQYRLLRFLPRDFASHILLQHFSETNLFNLFMADRWAELKSKLPYVVFDLETDGDRIREYAFRSGDSTHYYEDEGQLDMLLNAVNSKPIVVGHRIKQWELSVLEQYGQVKPAFVWDTLEIEILLNPCRYAYSLHTQHNAKYDTELTDRLFWNQLFRLATNDELCTTLSDFLPENITPAINELRLPQFAKYLSQPGILDEAFFQSLQDIDRRVAKSLEAIDNDTESEALIVAPQRLWNRISEHISISFMSKDINYLTVSEEKLKENPLQNPFLQTVLLRFCRMSKTPIVSNLASYLRINYFNDSLLHNYVTSEGKGIRCADLRIIRHIESGTEYHRINFVGCELENRLNQYSLSTTFRAADFWQARSSIPMRLGGSSYALVSREDRKSSLFDEIPKDAANVWIERTRDGKYIVNYNFNVYKKLKELWTSPGTSINIAQIPWLETGKDNQSIALVHSDKRKGYDYLQNRVNATSKYRSTYWTYQLALLRSIHHHEGALPIIYILDDDLELDRVITYAERLGFYIPREGTLVTRLEKITKYANGLLIISKAQFFEVTEKRLYAPYCFVWDQMAVEKHMMMWYDLEENFGDSILVDNVHEDRVELSHGLRKDTYQSILLSIWPIYQYYSTFILANNSSSKMYIIDSYLEEYHTLSSIWKTRSFVSDRLWGSEKTFKESLSVAQDIFVNDDTKDKPGLSNDSIATAMNVILYTMVPKREGKREWSKIQKEVLPNILSKKENYLVSIPTGGGKSVLFQGPALYNASYTNRLSLVISPLKALMTDQVHDLWEKGFYTNVDFINSDRTSEEVHSIYRKITSGEIALLYITPERFRSRGFLNALSTRMMNDNGLEYIIFDEAHCISQWGMEFRPEYLNAIKRCKEFRETYKGGMCVAMFSATVTDMIYSQINQVVPVKRLGEENDRIIYNPVRSHISMSFRHVASDLASRVNAIVSYIQEKKPDFSQSRMLIFCRTRKQCEELATDLAANHEIGQLLPAGDASDQIGYFHARMDPDDRNEIYNRFKSTNNPIYILCATKAFGMGMDIPNIHYLLHYSPPNVLEDFLQEVGRAGRDKDTYLNAGFSEANPIPALCLVSEEDMKKSRDLLKKNSLCWNELETIRDAICRYISSIQSIEKSKTTPVVVPNNLWRQFEDDNGSTNFKIGEYWLERMGRIKMGYLLPAHISITLSEKEGSVPPLFAQEDGKVIQRLYTRLLQLSEERGTITIQVSHNELSRDLSVPPSKVLDLLIRCAKDKLLTINEEVRCRIAKTRRDEVPYLLKHPNEELALHVILNATEKLLRGNELNKERSYTAHEVSDLVDFSFIDRLELIKIPITRDDESTEKVYMPWYEEPDKEKRIGLSLVESYKSDLIKKRIRQIFATLLDVIPDVKCKSYIDREGKSIRQSILIQKNTWKEFLPAFRQDCLSTLEYISTQQDHNIEKINWSKAINTIDLAKKEFAYFDAILRYLFGMGYIARDNLLTSGVEIYTTDITEESIPQEPKPESKDQEAQKTFEEAREIRHLRLCVMEALTCKVDTSKKEDLEELISEYFRKSNASDFIELLGKYFDEHDKIWNIIRETAIKTEEDKMKANPEQWAIYDEDPKSNVNVEAGPGSGKTYVLTMRCAKLLYRMEIPPREILVLAYNRAVVLELKSRLNKLLTSLGLPRSANQLHVYTFHGLAKRVCGNELDEADMSVWEDKLLKLLRERPGDFSKVIGRIHYVLVDEFQDITQTRLDSLFELKKMYPDIFFFTIGDRNQSIYGFDKKKSHNPVDPEYYYDQLYKTLQSKKMTMNTNYRSFPKILEAASAFLPDKSMVPVPCKANKEAEPATEYSVIYDSSKRNWADDFPQTISELKKAGMEEVAVFFRSNSEVYNGYALIKDQNIPDIRIRIQGISNYELYRKREIFALIRQLEAKGNELIILDNDKTKRQIKEKVNHWIELLQNWDSFYLDLAYTLVIEYLEQVSDDEETPTYKDMVTWIKETLSEDSSHLYKLYEKHKGERILQDKQMDVVLTTMHKVKGLEFDAVIVTPSSRELPYGLRWRDTSLEPTLTDDEREDIEEENRLLYVSYTRARKYLAVYKGPREKAVIQKKTYDGEENSQYIIEQEPSLKNYNIGFNATQKNFENNKMIGNEMEKNAPVTIQRVVKRLATGETYFVYNIIYKGQAVGQLAKESNIRQSMDALGLDSLSGYFVNDIFYWSYDDSVQADKRNRTNFASKWSYKAQKEGYIFIVSISGIGHP